MFVMNVLEVQVDELVADGLWWPEVVVLDPRGGSIIIAVNIGHSLSD